MLRRQKQRQEPRLSFTHADLVDVAREWLRRKHAVVVTELSNGSLECPDAIGFSSYGASTLIECKASRSDFKADAHKLFRREPHQGMGQHRYFLAPCGLLSADELPAGWGLLEWTGRHVRQTFASSLFTQRNSAAEQVMLVSVLRRLGKRVDHGVYIQCYTVKRVRRGAEPKNRATLSVLVEEEADAAV